MNIRLLLLPLLLATFFVSGCETTPDTERPNLREPLVVKRGSLAEELIATLGQPDLKHPLAEYSVDAEVWVYHRTLSSDSKLIFTGTEEQKYWDPLQRRMVVIEVPRYSPEVTSNVEVTEILMIKDRVYSWKRKNSDRRDVDGLTR